MSYDDEKKYKEDKNQSGYKETGYKEGGYSQGSFDKSKAPSANDKSKVKTDDTKY